MEWELKRGCGGAEERRSCRYHLHLCSSAPLPLRIRYGFLFFYSAGRDPPEPDRCISMLSADPVECFEQAAVPYRNVIGFLIEIQIKLPRPFFGMRE